MKRVMFAGDIHGNITHAKWLFSNAFDNKVDYIIACGDFGYWAHMKHGKKFIKEVARMAEQTNIKLYWVDGNHENHDMLDELARKHGELNPIPTPNEWVMWIPRGCRFDIAGHTFMGYGGAYSVDWDNRIEGYSWWRQELINEYAVDSLEPHKVDVLVSHEAPLGKRISYKDEIRTSVRQRELMQEIQDKVNPSLHVCGHHHTRKTWMNGDTEVNVLGRDDMHDESVLIRDFEDK